jgi:hypothetical protein
LGSAQLAQLAALPHDATPMPRGAPALTRHCRVMAASLPYGGASLPCGAVRFRKTVEA